MSTNAQDKQDAGYDRKIVSAETAARMEREGDNFKQLPESEESVHTTGGYTMDREGLLNNYPIEPEMYVNVPGDLRTQQDAEAVERALELEEINREGGKGPGII